MRKVLTLVFKTSKRLDARVTINRPVLNLDGKIISSIMEQIIEAGVIDGAIDKKSATYVQTTSENISIEN